MNTDYGFIWEQLEVQRLAEIKGTKVVAIDAKSNRVTVYVSPTGRSVRVFKNGKEMKA
jgi:hypothetical protein